MPCFYPLQAYRRGDFPPVFSVPMGQHLFYKELKLPCGRCTGCRLERSRQWAQRCMHEASFYDNNTWLTLTYAVLPEDGSLRPRDMVLFLKRLRKKFGADIRFFQCGEYGELFDRPHHHVCLFNYEFIDKYFWRLKNGRRFYRSPSLEKLWTLGNSEIGDLTEESAGYTARYIMKKINGKMMADHYANEDGVIRHPEYITMSRRPGIGRKWIDKFMSDVYPEDFVLNKYKIPCKPPRYYDKIFDLTNPEEFERIKVARERRANEHSFDNTPERLAVREEVLSSRLRRLKRGFEASSLP